ncbi:unnamed protein product [Arabis nemorensis]|uniref:Uncharacterized protein n=1 Tax=Arabis nemorensis TaxID=586526 RepID=A0A565AYY4_9BRAS|nr:unnamed protein product [Arabis nemorensis]
MALRLSTLKRAAVESRRMFEPRSFRHFSAIPPPLSGAFDRPTASPPLVLPEFYQDQLDFNDDKSFGFGFPSFYFGGSTELMAVPKKKVSKYKRGLRNGPKALKPTPVIIRCSRMFLLPPADTSMFPGVVGELSCHISTAAAVNAQYRMSKGRESNAVLSGGLKINMLFEHMLLLGVYDRFYIHKKNKMAMSPKSCVFDWFSLVLPNYAVLLPQWSLRSNTCHHLLG